MVFTLKFKKADPVIISEFEFLLNSLLDKALTVPEVFVHRDYTLIIYFFWKKENTI